MPDVRMNQRQRHTLNTVNAAGWRLKTSNTGHHGRRSVAEDLPLGDFRYNGKGAKVESCGALGCRTNWGSSSRPECTLADTEMG